MLFQQERDQRTRTQSQAVPQPRNHGVNHARSGPTSSAAFEAAAEDADNSGDDVSSSLRSAY